MKDIAPELLLKLQEEFKKEFNASRKIKELNKKLLEGNVTHQESNELAIELGTLLSDIYMENIKSERLPEGKLFYNIARRTIEPTIKQNYDLISNYSRDVQTTLNKKAGLKILGIPPDINQDRIDGIINRVSSENFEEVRWILNEPIKNFSQSIVDDTVKTNADFHYELGLKPKIVRQESGSCCDWCKEVVGVYEYPKVPKDVYRRHRYCRCSVDYHPGDGKVQNVHTKKWIDLNRDDKINIRKKIALVEHSSSINIVKKVHSGEIDLTSNKEHYEKHLLGTKQFDQHLENRIKKGYGKQSILTISYEETQRLINEFYGKGIVQSTKSGKPRKQEDVNFRMIIGYYIYEGKEYPTTKGRIHYGKKGTHIVPIKGDNFD